jgi:hypothetical protein
MQAQNYIGLHFLTLHPSVVNHNTGALARCPVPD